jgi:hypothetical protein
MENWKNYFEVKEVDESEEEHWALDVFEYHLINKHTGEVLGIYKDKRYAEKQAKYKYKKILSKLEKSLLG